MKKTREELYTSANGIEYVYEPDIKFSTFANVYDLVMKIVWDWKILRFTFGIVAVILMSFSLTFSNFRFLFVFPIVAFQVFEKNSIVFDYKMHMYDHDMFLRQVKWEQNNIDAGIKFKKADYEYIEKYKDKHNLKF